MFTKGYWAAYFKAVDPILVVMDYFIIIANVKKQALYGITRSFWGMNIDEFMSWNDHDKIQRILVSTKYEDVR